MWPWFLVALMPLRGGRNGAGPEGLQGPVSRWQVHFITSPPNELWLNPSATVIFAGICRSTAADMR